MQKVSSHKDKWRNVLVFLTALGIVGADLLSKIWINASLDIGQSLPEAGFFRLTHVQNTGAAFGLFRGQSFLLSIVAGLGIVLFLTYVFYIHRYFPYFESMLGGVALGLVLGGTVGNLIDRLRFGYVTDFIGIGIWPSFNIADSAVVVGVILLAYSLLALTRDGKYQEDSNVG